MNQYHYAPPKQQARRKSKKGLIFLIFLLLCVSVISIAWKHLNIAAAENEPPLPMPQQAGSITDITAANAYVLNIDTNTVFFQKNSDEQIAPASTAKLVTALTVLDYCSLDEEVTVGNEIDFVSPDSSRAWLNYGSTLTVEQLLVALLLPSGNDAAYTLATYAGAKIAAEDNLSSEQYIDDFIQAMNEKARELGAASSNFTSPDGYDESGQYTTAYDLAQIAKACLDHDVLAEIMGSYQISSVWPDGEEITYYNSNELLELGNSFYYANAIGLKTGNSSAAGSCLVSAAVINGETYVCVVMGAVDENRYWDTLAIYAAIE